ncbi:MAG: RloB domain-containing protein, partial [Bacteroidota bacterium]
FELWLLLHFEAVDYSEPIPRSKIYSLLAQAVINASAEGSTYVYAHGKADILEKVNKLGNEPLAIERAKELEAHFKEVAPLNANPSTKVHHLVTSLRSWIRYHNWTGN